MNIQNEITKPWEERDLDLVAKLWPKVQEFYDLPDLPKGAVYCGMGAKGRDNQLKGYAIGIGTVWHPLKVYWGDTLHYHYARDLEDKEIQNTVNFPFDSPCVWVRGQHSDISKMVVMIDETDKNVYLANFGWVSIEGLKAEEYQFSTDMKTWHNFQSNRSSSTLTNSRNQNMNNKPIWKSFVWHKDKCFFVSTIERDYDVFYETTRGFETFVWEYDWEAQERGELVHQGGGLLGHQAICRCIITEGQMPDEDNMLHRRYFL